MDRKEGEMCPVSFWIADDDKAECASPVVSAQRVINKMIYV